MEPLEGRRELMWAPRSQSPVANKASLEAETETSWDMVILEAMNVAFSSQHRKLLCSLCVTPVLLREHLSNLPQSSPTESLVWNLCALWSSLLVCDWEVYPFFLWDAWTYYLAVFSFSFLVSIFSTLTKSFISVFVSALHIVKVLHT